jgi:hypothetical protein
VQTAWASEVSAAITGSVSAERTSEKDRRCSRRFEIRPVIGFPSLLDVARTTEVRGARIED